ncbi:MAG: hypothetical protein ACRDQ0_22795, partial [Pseudonocardia sp.]
RWAVAGAAALLAGGGFVGGGIAVAGGEPDNAGAPGTDGGDATVTCSRYQPPVDASYCNVVGEDGSDGRSSTVGG